MSALTLTTFSDVGSDGAGPVQVPEQATYHLTADNLARWQALGDERYHEFAAQLTESLNCVAYPGQSWRLLGPNGQWLLSGVGQ